MNKKCIDTLWLPFVSSYAEIANRNINKIVDEINLIKLKYGMNSDVFKITQVSVYQICEKFAKEANEKFPKHIECKECKTLPTSQE